MLLSTIEPIDHRAYRSSSLSIIEPIDHRAYRPSSLSTIKPIDHRAYQPSSLLTIEPINHRAYQPSSLSTIEPINHRAYQPSSLSTLGLLSRLLSLSACFFGFSVKLNLLPLNLLVGDSKKSWEQFVLHPLCPKIGPKKLKLIFLFLKLKKKIVPNWI